MSSAEQSAKNLAGPAWEFYSKERREMAVAIFERAVARLAEQIEADIFASATAKPARGNLKDAAK
jgi:hypothetical protein